VEANEKVSIWSRWIDATAPAEQRPTTYVYTVVEGRRVLYVLIAVIVGTGMRGDQVRWERPA
jgi:hypothetical protein